MKTESKKFIILNNKDNVATALVDLPKGDWVGDWVGERVGQKAGNSDVELKMNIHRGHKVALKKISKGEEIIKYGQNIGFAFEEINEGEHVHVHNVNLDNMSREYTFGQNLTTTEWVEENERVTFMGYRRENGKVGTRNYIGIVSSVNCSSSVATQIAREVEKQGLLDNYPNVDGVTPIIHSLGCGSPLVGEPFQMLQRTIWGHATHPNFGGVLMVGLGCETNQISEMVKESRGVPNAETFNYMTMQERGGTRKTVEAGVEWFKKVLPKVNDFRREEIPASELSVALQCGGSDGFSGITANPALGVAVDKLVRHGGTGLLAETPEVYGGEHLLTGRAVSQEVGQKLVDMVKWWEDYSKTNGSDMNNNPSPGNKAGGLTNIFEKSLGAIAKGGTTNLVEVYKYGERLKDEVKGFSFMDSPGYDPCSITGQVASGCNVVCFTTGRGSCYGNKLVPSIKLATNTPMFERMSEDMDINCGTIVDGTRTLEEVGEEIFQRILDTASGKKTYSEELGIGESEIIPWRLYAQM